MTDAKLASDVDLEAEVTRILYKARIPANISGFDYLRTAIIFSANNPEAKKAITKELYPEVAKRHNTTAPRAERSIRHAIETAWCRGGRESLLDYLFYEIELGDNSGRKPTNSEFIAAIADHLRLKIKRGVTV